MDVLQVAQHVDDLDRAEQFYTKFLGRSPVARFDPPGLIFYRLGPVRLLLDRGAPAALHYLGVDDLHAKVKTWQAAGIEIVGEPHVIFHHEDDLLGPAGHDEWQAFVRDSEGNLVGLVEQRLNPSQSS